MPSSSIERGEGQVAGAGDVAGRDARPRVGFAALETGAPRASTKAGHSVEKLLLGDHFTALSRASKRALAASALRFGRAPLR